MMQPMGDMRTTSPDPIRVCQIWGYYLPLPSGAAIRHNQLATSLREQGIHVEVLTPQWNGTRPQETVNGTPVRRVTPGPIGNRSIQWIWSSLQLCRELWSRRTECDVVHTFATSAFHAPVLLLAKLLHKPVLIDFTLLHGKMTIAGEALTRLAYLVFRSMDAYVGISTPLMQSLVERGLSPRRCYLVPCGVDPDTFARPAPAERVRLRDELGLDRSVCYLIFVGSFIQRKGVDILLDMMALLREERDDVQLLVVGRHDFPERHPARQFAEQMKGRIRGGRLRDCVHLVGLVDPEEVVRWLQASDAFVFPSRREGQGRVIVEAMSVGLPCVCSDLDGIAYDMIQPGINGIVVTDGDPTAYAKQVMRLVAEPSLRRYLGGNARDTVVARFDERTAVVAYKRLYQELLDSQ